MSLNKIQKFLIIKIYTCVSSIRDHLYLRYPGIKFLNNCRKYSINKKYI